MKVAQIVDSRRENWRQLEELAWQMESRGRRKMPAPTIVRFGTLYRAACADLALADAYQLPPNTVAYLHHLVGRAHNQLYRSRRFNVRLWAHELFVTVPRRLYSDNCLRLAFFLFWSVFIGSLLLARSSPEFAKGMLGQEWLTGMEENFSEPLGTNPKDSGTMFRFDRNPNVNSFMAGYYIQHNTGIGLKCFAYGLLFGIGGLFATVYNAAALGASFGYMMTVPQRDNFFQFVTAHGPFELTAIVLSAAAGMRLGFALVHTGGLTRRESMRLAGREAMPTMGAAIAMFGLAALIEGFLSPSSAPYAIKAFVAVLSSGLLMVYFILLGYPGEPARAAR